MLLFNQPHANVFSCSDKPVPTNRAMETVGLVSEPCLEGIQRGRCEDRESKPETQQQTLLDFSEVASALMQLEPTASDQAKLAQHFRMCESRAISASCPASQTVKSSIHIGPSRLRAHEALTCGDSEMKAALRMGCSAEQACHKLVSIANFGQHLSAPKLLEIEFCLHLSAKYV